MLKKISALLLMLSIVSLASGDDGSDNTSITADATWKNAVKIGTGIAPQIAIDSNGNALAVWQQWDGNRHNIWSNRYVTGRGWGTATLIETDNSGHAEQPQIVIDSNGNALAVWSQSNGKRRSIWSNRYITGSGWGTATLIETDDIGHASHPQIAIDSNGNALAVWRQHDGNRYNIWSNHYVTATGWGTARLIETDNAGTAIYPQIAMNSNGNALVVWRQSFRDARRSVRKKILSNRFDPRTGWATATQIDMDDAQTTEQPQIAIDSKGNALAIWRQFDGKLRDIWSNRYVAGSGWGTPTLIETDNAGTAEVPQIAIDSNGNALAVWRQDDGTRYNIWSNRYATNTWGIDWLSSWGSAELIETDNAGSVKEQQITVDSHGNALAVWHQSDGTRTNIWSNHYVAGIGWGTATLIETDNTGAAGAPQIAINNNGNALAVWIQYDGEREHYNIWSNRLE